MVFSSSTFLLAFLPLTLVVYFLCPKRALRNVWLLAASLFFYAWGEPIYVVLMVISILVNWLLALGIGPAQVEIANEAATATVHARRKTLLVATVVFNILVIGFFKYEGFVAQSVNSLFGGMQLVPDLELPLPIGISFYTLQALSYVIDVYRGEVEPQRNVLYLGMYVACFPQLIAGPIVRYKTIADQVVGRVETLSDFTSGMRLFIVGLAKKVLLANVVAILANDMLAGGGAGVGLVGAWGGLIAYTFQIFFDFSGYSDMAIGLGRMMGFKYLRNFNYPYISRSITEFWRRWHISLSSFFRDYVYIPLGGSRCSVGRHIFNIGVVWAITGLWHGAAWNYVLWGVYYGVLLICEKYLWGKQLSKLPAAVGHLYAIAIVMFGWSFFWITDPSQLVPYWQALIGMYGATGTASFWSLGVWGYLPVFVVCLAASLPIMPFAKERFCAWIEDREPRRIFEDGIVNPKAHAADPMLVLEAEPADSLRSRMLGIANIALDVVLVLLLVVSLASVVSGSYNPFIYFQF